MNSRESAWVGGGFVLQYSAQAVRAVFLARILAPHDLGIYFVLRGIAVAGSVATQLGLGQVGLRRVAAARDDPAATLAAINGVLFLTTAATLVAVPVVVLLGRVSGLSLLDAVLVATMMAALAWTATLADLGRGLGQTVAVSALERVFGSVADLAALLGLFLAAGRCTLTQVLALTTGVSAITLLLLARLVKRAAPRPAAVAATDQLRRRDLLDESWPIASNTLLWKALAELDLWLVAYLGTPASAAVYGIALRLTVPLDLPKSITSYQLSPHIAQTFAAGQAVTLERMLKRSARWTTIATVAGYLAVIGLGTRGLEFLLGPAYAATLPVFVVLGIGRIVSAASGLAGVTLLMTGHSRVVMKLSILSTTLMAVTAIILIPRLGPVGAAFAASAGFTCQCVLMLRAVDRYARLSVHAGPRFG